MSGWTMTSSRFHDDLKEAMQPYQGKQLKTAEISKILQGLPGLAQNARFIQPADHCRNVKNFGACTCAHTDKAIFDKLQRGLFHVREVD
jgi:predicted unusual protein kinase regulating ubiquinone biosynthesis (AarF/ABC1/UbiB family)